jgi:biopolymer transport protein ExbD
VGAPLETGRKKRGLVPVINVTPLVDVVLVLLIIFMVVLPSVQDGKPIEMVKVEAADKTAEDVEPLTVTIDRKEVFTLGDQDMNRVDVLTALRTAQAKEPRRKVVLRADAALPYRVVREFFRDVQELGFGGVSLAVAVGREWSQKEG